MNTIFSGKVSLSRPTYRDIVDLKIGDIAPYVFGEAPVDRVYARGTDSSGRAYVLYYVSTGRGSSMSGELREGEVVRDMCACAAHTSAELREFDLPSPLSPRQIYWDPSTASGRTS